MGFASKLTVLALAAGLYAALAPSTSAGELVQCPCYNPNNGGNGYMAGSYAACYSMCERATAHNGASWGLYEQWYRGFDQPENIGSGGTWGSIGSGGSRNCGGGSYGGYSFGEGALGAIAGTPYC